MTDNELDALAQVTDRAQELKTKYGIRYTKFSAIEAAPVKKWLVKDFLGAGEMSCAYGPPGSAKSLLVGDLAAHIARGTDWMGRRIMQGAVLYVAAERAALVQRRFAAFRLHHGLDDAEIPLVVLSGSFDLCAGRTSTEGILDCAKRLQDESESKISLIAIDTLNRVLAGGDENSAKDMGALIANIATISEATGAHILVTHHVPHTENRMRGHGALLGACDTTIKIEKGDLRIATIEKQNDGPEGERVAFNIRSVELSRDETGKPTEAPVIVPIEGEIPKAKANRRLGPRDSLAVKALGNVLATKGKPKPPTIDAPINTVADLEDWREELLASGVIDTTDINPWQSFKRIRQNLANRQIIGERNSQVWLS
jgi:AAA domain